MKIAVLLCGHIRTFSKTKESFKMFIASLQSVNFVDVYVSTYYQQNGFHKFIQQAHGLYDNKLLTHDEIEIMLKDLDLKTLCVEDEEKVNDQIKQESVNFEEGIFYHDIFAQYRKIQNLLKLIEPSEYDLIIKTRFDVVYNTYPVIETVGTYLNTDCFLDYVIISDYPTLKYIVDNVFKKGFYNCEIDKQTWSIHLLLKHVTKDLPLKNVFSVDLIRK